MGSCSSVQRSKRQTVASSSAAAAAEPKVQRSKRQTVASSSAAAAAEPKEEEGPLNVNGEEISAVKVVGCSFSLKSSQFGSKDETFFDSRAWLDSDCDDDFFSVNGDFTPSRGTTPNNQTSILPRTKSDKTLALDKLLSDSKSEPSPTGRKKLSDLFQETAEPNASDEKLETNKEQDSSNRTKSEQPPDRANSKTNSELSTPSRELRNKKAGDKMAQCCFLSLGQSFSCSERSQKMSPVHCSA